MIKRLIYNIKLNRYYTSIGLKKKYAAINTVHGIHCFFKKFFAVRCVEVSEYNSFRLGEVIIKVYSWIPLSNKAIKEYKQVKPMYPTNKLINKSLFGIKTI